MNTASSFIRLHRYDASIVEMAGYWPGASYRVSSDFAIGTQRLPRAYSDNASSHNGQFRRLIALEVLRDTPKVALTTRVTAQNSNATSQPYYFIFASLIS